MKKNIILAVLAFLWICLIVFARIQGEKAQKEADFLQQQIEECRSAKQ